MQKKTRKYAEGGELDALDSLATGDPVPASNKIPLPDYKNPQSRSGYAQAFRNKYGKEALKGYGDIPLRINEKPVYGSRTSKQAAIEEAKALGLNPALFYASAMIEGQSGLYADAYKDPQGNVGWRGYTGDKDYPISGSWGFGLDSFADYYPGLVKKGYLPKDFDKQFKIWDGEGDAPEGSQGGSESSMFKTADAGMKAKAAMMRAFYDESDAYASKKGYKLTPEQRDYFALAHFNSGSHGYEMMDAYNKAGLLKNNDFITSGTIPKVNVPFMYQGKQMGAASSAKLHQQIYGNISPRMAAARGLQEEGLFEYGGKMPAKPYASGGTIDPEKPGKKATSKVSPPLIMPTEDDKGFVLPNGETVYGRGRVGLAPIMPEAGNVSPGLIMPFTTPGGEDGTIFPNGATGRVSPALQMPTEGVSGGFVMPFNAGGDEGLIYPNGATSKTSLPLQMPSEGNISDIFSMPMRANTKLRGVKEYAEGGVIEIDNEGNPKYSDQENYYRASAKLSHYKSILNEKLKAKNPKAFADFFKGLVPLRKAGNATEVGKYIQGSDFNDYLSTDEVKKSLGADYQDYLDSIQAVNSYDVAQGKQPLYGTKESGADINALNYGRRFASLALTPVYGASNQTRGTSYNRSYTYDPKKKEVSFTETGDTKLRPSGFLAPEMKKGGRMPKYQDGTPDPIPGLVPFQPSGTQVGNLWNLGDAPAPANPNSQPLMRVDNSSAPVNQPNTVPINSNYVDDYNAQQQSLADQVSAQNQANAMATDRRSDAIEFGASTGIAAINSFFAKQQAGQQDRTNRRNAILQQTNLNTINPYAEGTGSQAIMKYGGGLSRGDDYGSKSKPYPNVASSDFAGGNRSYPIPTKADAEDALRLAHLHGRSDVIAKVHEKYPELKKEYGDGGVIPLPKTNLNPDQEKQYNEWKNKLPKNLQYEGNYNLRQLWLENPNQKPSSNMHFPDKYKLPNHPTFSNESMYFNPTNQYMAGKWQETDSSWNYTPYNTGYKQPIIERKFENGGELLGQDQGIQVLGGGKVKPISASDHSNPMFEFSGREHSQGGIPLQYGGSLAEVENKEVGWVDQEGGLNIFGKLKLPGTNQTFRKAALNIAEEEKKVDGKKSKYLNILTNSNETNSYQESAKSTAKVMFKSLDKQSMKIAEKKEALSSYQNLILAMADQAQASQMKYGGKMPIMPKFEEGGEVDPDPTALVRRAIAEFESGAKYDAIGVPVTKGQYKGQRALGKYQIMEDNVRNWGKEATGRDITVAEFIKDPALQDQIAEYQMRQIAKSHPNPADIASIWFTGKPAGKAGKITDDNGTSGNQYIEAVMKIYAGYGGKDGSSGAATGFTGNTAANDLNTGKRVTTDDIMNYKPVYGGAQAGAQSMGTAYGDAFKNPSAFGDNVNITSNDNARGVLSPLAIGQIAPELLTMATNRREPVYQLSYQPDLQQTFDISYQLGRNENQSTFNQVAKIAESTGNIEALSQLAAQKYQADQAYNTQEVQGNAQQRLSTYNQNTNTLNDARMKNLALIADQQAKQSQAKFNTRQEDLAAIKSISGKVLQNQLENRTYNAYANLFKHYGFDKNGNVTFNPDKITKRFTTGEAQQFGMMAAQQGVNAIMNGDYSRQFTKVKNQDGSTTTTETLGTNKKIQEEYNVLKKQGFDDNIIGNMLRAKYPETVSGN